MIIALIFIAIMIPIIVYFCKKANAESKNSIFPYFDDSIHFLPEQQDRIFRSLFQNIRVQSVSSDGSKGKIIGTYGNVYDVSLSHCSCMDFQKRSKPCKHMYKLVEYTGRCSASWNGNQCIINRMLTDEDYNSIPDPAALKSKQSEFHDSMNYMIFEGEGIFLQTGRKRKLSIEAFSETEAMEQLHELGFDPNQSSIHRSHFEPPTDAQLSSMRSHGDEIPKNACKIDISFYMSKIIDREKEPDINLIRFATQRKVKLSYFTGEESLYLNIWNSFNQEEKAAFYIMCVKKDRTRNWSFELFDSYKEKAKFLLNDKKFMNSFKRYLTSEFLGFNGDETSRNTNCYKIAADI